MDGVKTEAKLRGQAEIWRCMFAFADTMALKCAVELRIADIIHTHGKGHSMSLSDIAKHIDSPNSTPNPAYLSRIMRFLVRRNIFAAQPPSSDGGDILYSLTPASLWLLRDADLTLAPEILLENDKRFMEAYHYLSQTVKEGVVGFDVVYGLDEWTYTGKDPEFNKMFNEGMACTAKVTMKTIVSEYKQEFEKLTSLVDVGGGIGSSMAEIVKAYPHIKGIVFDLPHVVETAPPCNGITYVGGDMFKSVPKADAVFMKWVLHDWGEDACVKILKNCRKAIPEGTGKVILAEIVLQPDGTDPFDEGRLGLDMDLLAHNLGGKERTELQWKKLLAEAGFPRYKIIKLPALVSLIEAYTN